jgi:hypothetical protein
MVKKLTYEFVKNEFEIHNCKLLETEYINCKTKMKYICKNGHETSVIFNRFQSGQRCGNCNGNEKLTFDYINQYFKDGNCKLMETKYINNYTKMNYICKNGHN